MVNHARHGNKSVGPSGLQIQSYLEELPDDEVKEEDDAHADEDEEAKEEQERNSDDSDSA